jgi:hypothetical protein
LPYKFNPFTSNFDLVNTSGGGGMTIGDPVIGGDPYDVLFIDGSGNLAQDDEFNYGGAGTGTLSIPNNLLMGTEGLSFVSIQGHTATVSGDNGTGFNLTGGVGSGAGNGGEIDITAGNGGDTGNGADAFINGGNGGTTSGNGGSTWIIPGQAQPSSGGDGGNAYFFTGKKDGAGTAGQFLFYDPTATYTSQLDFSSISANRVFTFQDGDGTLAFLSDITGGTPSAPDTSLQFNNSGSFGGTEILYTEPDTINLQLKVVDQALTDTQGINLNFLGSDGDGIGRGGDVTFKSGGGTANGGGISFIAADVPGSAGDMTFTGGSSSSSGYGGGFFAYSGAGNGGDHTGGTIQFQVGSSVGDGNGAPLNFFGGPADGGGIGVGGSIYLAPGTGGGGRGNVVFSGARDALWDLSLIATSDKTFTLPNNSGTIALTSDIPVVTGFATKALDNLASVAINTTLVSDTDITDDLGTGLIRWKDIHSATLNAGVTATNTLKLRGYDVDGTAYVDILTITSANTVTAVLAAAVTSTTQSPNDNSTKLATTAYVDNAVLGQNF